MDRRTFLRATLVGGAAVPALSGGSTPASLELPSDSSTCPREFRYHHDHVLGTSLDLVVFAADESLADAAERAVTAEIERLRRILSTYDPDACAARLNRSDSPIPCPFELFEVLAAYEHRRAGTGGAVHSMLGGLIDLWRRAEAAGVEPDPAELRAAASAAAAAHCRLDPAAGTITRVGGSINLDGIGKSYIVDRAVAAALRAVPGVAGLLLDVGGDLRTAGPCGGEPAWRVGVADPRRSADNAPPLTTAAVRDCAVATSGSYQRGLRIGGRRRSHILDPRTGLPADRVASATVIASDGIAAGSLATALCVLTPAEGLRAVAQTPGAECLIVTADDRRHRSEGWAAREAAPPVAAPGPVAVVPAAAAAAGWPPNHEVTITLTLPVPTTGKKIRRPYVVVWCEDEAGKPVRTMVLWGNEGKYHKDLTVWWRFARNTPATVRAVSRATRPPGKYVLAWDGVDDAGRPVPAGTYLVQVEVHREFGAHVRQAGKIVCGAEKSRVVLPANSETGETTVEYGPRGA